MITLPEQKYSNNIRTVEGSVAVMPNDVILEVNTTIIPCSIQLAAIPAHKWSTQYKIYIVDKNNNANVNNITILAQTGQLINGAPSITISESGAIVVISIVAENNYISLSSGAGGAGVNGHVIADEGVALPQRPTLNFLGGGVLAEDDIINNRTNVNVIGGITALTHAEMLALIASESVVPSQFYRITDAQFTDGGIVLIGITTSSISIEGRSLHLNADYRGVGDYSGVTGFTAAVGIWNPEALTYNLGEVVVYNNLLYINISTPSPGSPPDAETEAWELLPKTLLPNFSSNQGYLFTINFSWYNLELNRLQKRTDDLNNEVDYALDKGVITLNEFPWGNPKFSYNKIFSSKAFIHNLCNNDISFVSNVISGTCYLFKISAQSNSKIEKNQIHNEVTITGNENSISIQMLKNNFFGGLAVANSSPLLISNNTLEENTAILVSSDTSMHDPSNNNVLEISQNYLSNKFNVDIVDVDQTVFSKTFKDNVFSKSGKLTIENWTDRAKFENNVIQTSLFFTIKNFENNNLQGGKGSTLIDNVISTFPIVVDFNDATIWTTIGGVLTIKNNWNYVGKFLCINSSGNVIEKIINSPVNFPYELLVSSEIGAPNNFSVLYTAIGVSVPGNIIQNIALANINTFQYYQSQPEGLLLKQEGLRNVCLNIRKWN